MDFENLAKKVKKISLAILVFFWLTLTLTDLIRTVFLEIRCVTEPTRDSDKLLCLDGKTVDKWNGCINRGSVRVQCPKGYYPCNQLRDNGKEFMCGKTCNNNGGKRECEFSYKKIECWCSPNPYLEYFMADLNKSC